MSDVTVDDLFNKIGRLTMETDQQKRELLAMGQEIQRLQKPKVEAPKKKAKK